MKKRVLIVDDDVRITQLVEMILKRHGFEVRTENNPCNAVETARRFKPDLILLDVAMPQMDGGDVAVALRGLSASSNVPITFVTSLVDQREVGGEVGERGGVEYMPKPFRPSSLLAYVERKLQATA